MFVVDTSGSMYDDHETLGQGFQNFTAHIFEFDYRIGFISADQYAASLKVVGQNGERYIDSSMLNKEDTISASHEQLLSLNDVLLPFYVFWRRTSWSYSACYRR